MYSQCPECLTRFRVTAAALRAAHGTVRCGRCGSAFDAVLRLTDSPYDEVAATSVKTAETSIVPNLLAEPHDPVAPGEEGGEITEFHFTPDDLEQVFVDMQDWQRQFGEGAPPATSQAEVGRAGTGTVSRTAPADVYVHEPEDVEDITLEGERIVIESLDEELDPELRGINALDELHDGRPDAVPLEADAAAAPQAPFVDLDPTDSFEVLRQAPDPQGTVPGERIAPAITTNLAPTPGIVASADAMPEPPATSPDAQVVPAPPADESGAAAVVQPQPAAPIVPLRPRDRSTAFEDALASDESDDEPRSRGAAVAWGFGALLLALTLGAQLVHQYRQEIARDARFGPIVREVYAQLGRPLEPNRDLGAFELRRWGADDPAASEAGVMTVRASLRNGASFAQPLPLLRLELEDRYGGTVARRDFAATEYLKNPAQAEAPLGPGAQAEAELVLVDVGADAVGYRLDVCLRDAQRGVRCAQAATGRHAR